jgi:hypothetical protein
MPKDWGESARFPKSCAPRDERPAPPRDGFGEDFGSGPDDGICKLCDGTGEFHGQLCKGCGGKGYLND